MEKKISFGFSKISKKPQIVSQKPPEKKNVELIDCLEGQAIKIKDAVEVVNIPLTIPLNDNAKNLLDRVKETRNKQRDLKPNDLAKVDDRPDSELTLDELAAREVLRDAQDWQKNKTVGNEKIHKLPLAPDKQPLLEGGEIPTLEDYENVPINDFGVAMLRGMGWKEGMGIGKKAKIVKMDQPECRPKGLGLGANKMVAETTKNPVDEEGKELILKPNGYAKIVAGKHKDQYCQIQCLDDENNLVVVKTAIKGDILRLNEVFLLLVSKKEYDTCSKVLNNRKYEEYKKLSDQNLDRQRRERRSNSRDISGNEADSNDTDDSRHKSSRESGSQSSSRKDYKTQRPKSSSEDTDDNSDSSQSIDSVKHSKYKRSNNKSSRARSSSSSDSDDSYRRKSESQGHSSRSGYKHRERDRSKERSGKSKKHKHRNRSSSGESGYEQNRRRKNKTKSRHRRYSDEESEEHYKKNMKSKR